MKGFQRPKASVLPDSALVPNHDCFQPAPNQFTHRLNSDLPFRYAGNAPESKPDGTLPCDTKVVLFFHDGGPECHVVDERGLYIVVPFAGLVRLSH